MAGIENSIFDLFEAGSMDLILCHITADFDTLGAAVGLTKLKPGARVVLTGGAHPAVRDFLALHRDEYPLIERRSVNAGLIRAIFVVDTQLRNRLGKAAEWFDLPDVKNITVYDHHLEVESDIPATQTYIEPVGAITTLIVEQLQNTGRFESLSPVEATVMALGIHVDTGSLTFDHATARDAKALAWLMEQGASLSVIAEYVDPGLSVPLQELLTVALEQLQTQSVGGYTLGWVLLETPAYIPGLSSLASQVMEITETDALLLGHCYGTRTSGDSRLTIIGRSQIPGLNLNELFKPWGGGGHQRATSLALREVEGKETLEKLVEQLKDKVPLPPVARELMSSPVRTIRPDTTIDEAQRILLRYGHSGLSVVDANDQLVGVISRRDLDIALHHGFSHAPVKGYMTTNLKTITPATPLPEIEQLMVTYDVGRLPVLDHDQLVGIVTRTDVLRELHQNQTIGNQERSKSSPSYCLVPASIHSLLKERLATSLWELLMNVANLAQERGWHLYLVGGGVRDLLLAKNQETLLLSDIDLVVDSCYQPADVGAGVEVAKALQQCYPNARLETHGAFQTAALLWHKDPVFQSLWIDIATARTEFYPYPAANPEVEASSIRQDLYRRDFTINALAVRLTEPRAGELLDFFGGLLDLQNRQIRVLHANSFIEDPTRIYRAVRFAVRLGFTIDLQTEGYIRHAINSGIYNQTQVKNNRVPALETRLKTELKYILQAPYWKQALQLLGTLGALKCIHSSLELDETLWKQIRFLDRGLQRFDVQQSLDHWQIRLESILAHLPEEDRGIVAQNLQLPADSIRRLKHLGKAETLIQEKLPQCQRPSEIVQLLRPFDLPSLILIAIHSSQEIRKLIWQYLSQLSQIQSPLNGHDLKNLGYKPGRQFKEILDLLLAARLDNMISDNRSEAEAFILNKFSQENV